MITKLRLNLMDIFECVKKERFLKRRFRKYIERKGKKKIYLKLSKKARLGKVKDDQLWIYIEFWIASCGNYEASYTWFQSLQNQ